MKVRDVFNAIHFISAILACIFLAFQLIIISANVILRYGFNSGISWMEEISTYEDCNNGDDDKQLNEYETATLP
jgi:TRAP-type C4-dicarboxylate transport system permease small subunit